MIDEEAFAIEAGQQTAARILSTSRLDAAQQVLALEAVNAGLRTAMAVYRKHNTQTQEANGQTMNDTDRAAVALLREAARMFGSAEGT